jgi:hypothetical protein
MPDAQVAAGFRIFRLPARVDIGVWTHVTAALEGAAAQASVQCVLDCTFSEHVRYQDLRQFARIVREELHPSRPILLIGLSRYCAEIFRFALEARDWDHFREVERLEVTERAWGNAGIATRAGQRGRAARKGYGRLLSLPSPN